MIRILLIIVLTFAFCIGPAGAQDRVVAIQSARIKPYNEALKGFKSACQQCDVKEFFVSDSDRGELAAEIRDTKPALLFAIGIDALLAARKTRNSPVVYSMVLNSQYLPSAEESVTGVSMSISPEKQIAALAELLKGRRNIGVFYDPEKTGAFVKRAQQAAQNAGLRLITKEVRGPKDVPSLIGGMKNEIDAFWMIPDTTVITAETVECIFLFSIANKVPVITFSDKYLEMGALVSLGIDAFDIGRQAGEMANKVLAGTDVRHITRTEARKVALSINLKVARKLGISFSEETLSKARTLN